MTGTPAWISCQSDHRKPEGQPPRGRPSGCLADGGSTYPQWRLARTVPPPTPVANTPRANLALQPVCLGRHARAAARNSASIVSVVAAKYRSVTGEARISSLLSTLNHTGRSANHRHVANVLARPDGYPTNDSP